MSMRKPHVRSIGILKLGTSRSPLYARFVSVTRHLRVHCTSTIQHSTVTHTIVTHTIVTHRIVTHTMGETELAAMSRTPTNADNDANSEAGSEDIELLGRSGLGAQRARLVAKQITPKEKLAIFASLLLLGFVYGLESILRGVYQVSTSGPLKSSARRSTAKTFT
jgi:hypothetical protein